MAAYRKRVFFFLIQFYVPFKIISAHMVVAFSKTYPACQTDDNGIKPGSNLTNADKRAAEPSRAEFLGIK